MSIYSKVAAQARALLNGFEQEEAAAKEFWGDFAAEDNTKGDLLILALYDFCRAVTIPVPMMGAKEAKSYLNPQGFRMLCIMLGVADVNYSAEEQRFLDFETVFNLHRKYYSMWGLSYVDVDDPMTGVKTPLISRKSMGTWVAYRMAIYPNETHQALNQALGTFPLLDPIQEEPFPHKTIPRLCLPPQGNNMVPNSQEIRGKIAENWPRVKGEILGAARQRGPSTQPGGSSQAQAMMNMAANNVVNAQVQAAMNTSYMAAASAGSWAAGQGSLATYAGLATQSAGIF